MATVHHPSPSTSTSMNVNAPVAPPTPQEISRKLSMSVHTKPVKVQTGMNTLAPSPVAGPQQYHQVSGTESDSDSFLSPDHSPLATQGPHPQGHPHYPGGATISLAASTSTKPLSSIAERRSGSGDETDEDEYDDPEGEGEGEEEIQQTSERPRRVAGDSIIKTGYLWKKGERRKTWKKRWFVLRPTQLAFYKSSAEYQLLRLLDLADIHRCTPVELKRHAHAFGLVSPERTYYLYAATEDDMREWVSVINGAREALVGISTQNSIATPPVPIPIPGAGTSASGSRSGAALVASSGRTPSPPSRRGLAHPVTSESDSEDGHVGSYNAATTLGTSPLKSNHVHAQKDPTKVVISGYLMKFQTKRRAWGKRWFVLTGEKLMYMANHMDTKRQRSIELNQILDALEYGLSSDRHHSNHASGVSASSPPHHGHTHTTQSTSPPNADDNDGSSTREAHTFKIVTTKRTYLLSAPSEEEEIQWLSAVRALIARRSGAGAATTANVGATAGSSQMPPAAGGANATKGMGVAQAGGNAPAHGNAVTMTTMGAGGGGDHPHGHGHGHVHGHSGSGHTSGSGSKISGRRRSASGNSALTIGMVVGESHS